MKVFGGHNAPAVPILDIDAADRDQPNNVVEYIKDIYEHLRQFEVKYQPSANYMASQTDITDRMRAILVDWLIDVHLKFKLRHETVRRALYAPAFAPAADSNVHTALPHHQHLGSFC